MVILETNTGSLASSITVINTRLQKSTTQKKAKLSFSKSLLNLP